MVAYIDAHRAEFGVEPICRVLQLAPSTYYAAKARELSPSQRSLRDAVMTQILSMSPLAWWGLGPPRGEPPA